LTEEDVGSAHRIHDARGEGAIVDLQVRSHGVVLEPRTLDLFPVDRRQGESDLVSACPQGTSEAEMRVHVPERAEAGEDDPAHRRAPLPCAPCGTIMRDTAS